MRNAQNRSVSPSRRQIVISGAVALVVAALFLILFVLPAEFGIDPTGFGKAAGLSGLSEGSNPELARGQKREGVLTPVSQPINSDSFQVELLPYEAIELKYTMAEGAPLLFSWSAPAPLNYDMHAHPFEGGEDLTESYGVAAAPAMKGLYIAPFTGIHGWYWQNRTLDPVTLTVRATGAFTASATIDTAGEHPRALTPTR
ncbi:hypothetical protein [Altericroceibacterium xinjiangense]|uniref:hypothetical protein n=1 Tax=Altericroceibacterium xinjiangense TaxID=762261 RepID=UPI0019D2C9F6|nr:hypothetical protein [Altericroceibacterium xinjiangense]